MLSNVGHGVDRMCPGARPSLGWMTTRPPTTLLRTLTFTGFLFEEEALQVEDRERRCRWAAMVEEATGEGINLDVEARGRCVRLHRLGGPSLEFDQGRGGADLILSYDLLHYQGDAKHVPCAEHRQTQRWQLRRLPRPIPAHPELDASARSIAYSSRGAWVDVLVSGALRLRTAVQERQCPAHVVVHRLATAADGWTVHHGLDAVVQVAVWNIITAPGDNEAGVSADRLRERLRSRR